MHVVVDGPNDGPLVVLGPSLGTDLGLWDPQAAALTDEHRVLRFDLPGHGLSPVPRGPVTVAGIAADVLAAVDELGVHRFSYAGVSIGGAIGLQLALDAPDRVDRLVVLASAARFPDPASWPLRAARVRSQGTEFLVDSRTGAWFTPEFAARHPGQAERLLAMLRATPPEGYAACAEAIGLHDVRDRLPSITAATLVIAGGEDPVTPVPLVREIATGIDHARFDVVSGVSHLLNAELPDVVSELLRKHLRA